MGTCTKSHVPVGDLIGFLLMQRVCLSSVLLSVTELLLGRSNLQPTTIMSTVFMFRPMPAECRGGTGAGHAARCQGKLIKAFTFSPCITSHPPPRPSPTTHMMRSHQSPGSSSSSAPISPEMVALFLYNLREGRNTKYIYTLTS